MTAHVQDSAQGGGRAPSAACRAPVGRGGGALTALHVPHQIGQAIEEVNSSNQELLRKYRRELQLRKKCHNELVRLKGDRGAGRAGAGTRLRGPRPGSEVVPPIPAAPSTSPGSCALSLRSCRNSLFEGEAAGTRKSGTWVSPARKPLANARGRRLRLWVATGWVLKRWMVGGRNATRSDLGPGQA